MADVGTGSGCLAVTLGLELEGSSVDAIDLSEDALAWANRNVEALGARVALHQGEGLEKLGELARVGGPYDLIVSNPPYVETTERELLSQRFESTAALGLYAPEGPGSLGEGADPALRERAPPGGLLLVELGHLQGQRVHDRGSERASAARSGRPRRRAQVLGLVR